MPYLVRHKRTLKKLLKLTSFHKHVTFHFFCAGALIATSLKYYYERRVKLKAVPVLN
jgi:hypothetical protein